MARPPKPWWHSESGEYRVVIRGQRHHLGSDKDEAERKFHELMAQPQEKPIRADSVVALIDEFLEWTKRNRETQTYAGYRKHLQSFVTVAWETGARPREMTRMEARYIEVKNQRAVIPMKVAKGKKRIRIVYFTDHALEIVTRRIEPYPEGALFRNTRGSMWTTSSVDCRFKRLLEKFGKRIALYDLRRSFCTRLSEAGVDPLTVSLLLGHVDTTVLTRVPQPA